MISAMNTDGAGVDDSNVAVVNTNNASATDTSVAAADINNTATNTTVNNTTAINTSATNITATNTTSTNTTDTATPSPPVTNSPQVCPPPAPPASSQPSSLPHPHAQPLSSLPFALQLPLHQLQHALHSFHTAHDPIVNIDFNADVDVHTLVDTLSQNDEIVQHVTAVRQLHLYVCEHRGDAALCHATRRFVDVFTARVTRFDDAVLNAAAPLVRVIQTSCFLSKRTATSVQEAGGGGGGGGKEQCNYHYNHQHQALCTSEQCDRLTQCAADVLRSPCNRRVFVTWACILLAALAENDKNKICHTSTIPNTHAHLRYNRIDETITSLFYMLCAHPAAQRRKLAAQLMPYVVSTMSFDIALLPSSYTPPQLQGENQEQQVLSRSRFHIPQHHLDFLTALFQLLRDCSVHVRVAAASALRPVFAAAAGTFAEPKLWPRLRSLFTDDHIAVRRVAIAVFVACATTTTTANKNSMNSATPDTHVPGNSPSSSSSSMTSPVTPPRCTNTDYRPGSPPSTAASSCGPTAATGTTPNVAVTFKASSSSFSSSSSTSSYLSSSSSSSSSGFAASTSLSNMANNDKCVDAQPHPHHHYQQQDQIAFPTPPPSPTTPPPTRRSPSPTSTGQHLEANTSRASSPTSISTLSTDTTFNLSMACLSFAPKIFSEVCGTLVRWAWLRQSEPVATCEQSTAATAVQNQPQQPSYRKQQPTNAAMTEKMPTPSTLESPSELESALSFGQNDGNPPSTPAMTMTTAETNGETTVNVNPQVNETVQTCVSSSTTPAATSAAMAGIATETDQNHDHHYHHSYVNDFDIDDDMDVCSCDDENDQSDFHSRPCSLCQGPGGLGARAAPTENASGLCNGTTKDTVQYIRALADNVGVLLQSLWPHMDQGQRDLVLRSYFSMSTSTRLPIRRACAYNFPAVAYYYLTQNKTAARSETNHIASVCLKLLYIWMDTGSSSSSSGSGGGGGPAGPTAATGGGTMASPPQQTTSVNDAIVDDSQTRYLLAAGFYPVLDIFTSYAPQLRRRLMGVYGQLLADCDPFVRTRAISHGGLSSMIRMIVFEDKLQQQGGPAGARGDAYMNTNMNMGNNTIMTGSESSLSDLLTKLVDVEPLVNLHAHNEHQHLDPLLMPPITASTSSSTSYHSQYDLQHHHRPQIERFNTSNWRAHHALAVALEESVEFIPVHYHTSQVLPLLYGIAWHTAAVTRGVCMSAVAAILGTMLRCGRRREVSYVNDTVGKWARAASFKRRRMLVACLKRALTAFDERYVDAMVVPNLIALAALDRTREVRVDATKVVVQCSHRFGERREFQAAVRLLLCDCDEDVRLEVAKIGEEYIRQLGTKKAATVASGSRTLTSMTSSTNINNKNVIANPNSKNAPVSGNGTTFQQLGCGNGSKANVDSNFSNGSSEVDLSTSDISTVHDAAATATADRVYIGTMAATSECHEARSASHPHDVYHTGIKNEANANVTPVQPQTQQQNGHANENSTDSTLAEQDFSDYDEDEFQDVIHTGASFHKQESEEEVQYDMEEERRLVVKYVQYMRRANEQRHLCPYERRLLRRRMHDDRRHNQQLQQQQQQAAMHSRRRRDALSAMSTEKPLQQQRRQQEQVAAIKDQKVPVALSASMPVTAAMSSTSSDGPAKAITTDGRERGKKEALKIEGAEGYLSVTKQTANGEDHGKVDDANLNANSKSTSTTTVTTTAEENSERDSHGNHRDSGKVVDWDGHADDLAKDTEDECEWKDACDGQHCMSMTTAAWADNSGRGMEQAEKGQVLSDARSPVSVRVANKQRD